MLITAAAIILTYWLLHKSNIAFRKAAPYQLVLDFSSTTSLKAAVNVGPFLLRLTAIVMLSTASQLASYAGCALPIRRSGDAANS